MLSQVFLLSNVKPSRPIGQRMYFALTRFVVRNQEAFQLVQRVGQIPRGVDQRYSLRLCRGSTDAVMPASRPVLRLWLRSPVSRLFRESDASFVLLRSQGAGRLTGTAP